MRSLYVIGFMAGIVFALLASAVGAAPVLSNTAEVKSATTSAAIDARWRRGRWHRGYFVGPTYRYGYGRWYSNSGCHIAGGYYRPNGCW